MIRKPVVAGQFYPSEPERLKKVIEGFGVVRAPKPQKVIACILPHAGYAYSGKVAAKVLSIIDLAPSCIILGPNHTGYGAGCSVMKEGEWLTPFGLVPIDTDLAGSLIENSKYLEEDEAAHAYEHSIEVELPLLQALCRKDFSFVPIVLASADPLVYNDLASAIATSIKTGKKPVTIIASSDMTHYESQASANKKDHEAIQAMLRLDEHDLLTKIERLGISMCGYVPAVVAMCASKILGAKKAELIAYQTSGDVTGDYEAVVGYAGILIP